MRQHLFQLFVQMKDSLIAVLATFSMFFAPISQVILAAFALSILDLITALFAAVKNKESITSSKFGKTFPKLLMYFLVLTLAHFFDVQIVGNLRAGFLDQILLYFVEPSTIDVLNKLKLTAGVGTLIFIREFMSVDENWKKYFGWSFIQSFTGIFTTIFNKIKLTKNAD